MKCAPIPAFTIVLVFLSSTLVSCAGGESPPAEPETPQPALEQRESIHHRVVHIEPGLITEIPEVARFCDELGLTAHRINVGDAELFVEEGEGVPLVLINGDWKRQNFYKPSPERMAQGALYEWDHDDNFNGVMGESMGGIDLTGAFDSNPIPTLILEGRWDLTWSEAKPAILHGNHPQATLVMFENAGHGIYDEETDRFFGVLEDFVRNLPEVSPPAITAYKSTLAVWDEERTAAPEYALRSAGWGWNSSRELAAEYSRDWLEEFDEARSFLRLGFALYDVEDYDEARIVFERMESTAAAAGDPGYEAVALIWQGHMLDLLGRRDEAILAYRRVVDMNLEDTWSHGQYGLSYSLSPYSRERIESPFKRIDNTDSS